MKKTKIPFFAQKDTEGKQTKIVKNILALFIVAIFLFSASLASLVFADITLDDYVIENNPQLKEMNDQIESKRKESDELSKRIQNYKEEIQGLEGDIVDLQSQMLILDNQIKKTELEILDAQVQIDKATLEITRTNIKIDNEKLRIDDQKDRIVTMLREIYHNDNKGYLEMLLLNDSFSDFFDKIKYLEDVESALHSSLEKVIAYKESLEKEKEELEAKKEELDDLKENLEDKMNELEETQIARSQILSQTVQSQQSYENLLFVARQEQQSINLELARSESKFRALLESEKTGEEVIEEYSTLLAWPVPFQGISAYFHDPEYPFRHIFEHPGVDLRTLINGVPSNGIKIRSAADGYVGKAKDAGMGYSYILVVHDHGLSTVYGHVSAIYVNEGQYIRRGEIIGLTGGAPGTRGAGSLTTGPHLHFEVRLDGIPVDPLEYLP